MTTILLSHIVVTTPVLSDEATEDVIDFPQRQFCSGKAHRFPKAVLLFRSWFATRDASTRPGPAICPFTFHDLNAYMKNASEFEWGHAICEELIDVMEDVVMRYIIDIETNFNVA